MITLEISNEGIYMLKFYKMLAVGLDVYKRQDYCIGIFIVKKEVKSVA